MCPDATFDVVKPWIVRLVMDVDIAGVLDSGLEQIPPPWVKRSSVLLDHVVVQVILHSPLARRGLKVNRHVTVVHPAKELMLFPATEQAGFQPRVSNSHTDRRVVPSFIVTEILNVDWMKTSQRFRLGEPLRRRFQPEGMRKRDGHGPVPVFTWASGVEGKQDLMCFVLAAAEGEIAGIASGKQANPNPAAPLNGQRFGEVSPEVPYSDGDASVRA